MQAAKGQTNFLLHAVDPCSTVSFSSQSTAETEDGPSLHLWHDAFRQGTDTVAPTAAMRLHSVHANRSIQVQLRIDCRIAAEHKTAEI
jgi:hypothetical protein